MKLIRRHQLLYEIKGSWKALTLNILLVFHVTVCRYLIIYTNLYGVFNCFFSTVFAHSCFLNLTTSFWVSCAKENDKVTFCNIFNKFVIVMLSGFVKIEILFVRFKQQVFITFILFVEPFAELIWRQPILPPSLTLPFPLRLLSLCMCAVRLPRCACVCPPSSFLLFSPPCFFDCSILFLC